MPNIRKILGSSSEKKTKPSNTNTTTLTTSPTPQHTEKCEIPTICVNVNEHNNNTIGLVPGSKQGILQCLPEIFTDIENNERNTKHNNLNGNYIRDEIYKPYIFGKCTTKQTKIKKKTNDFLNTQQSTHTHIYVH